MKKMRGGLTKRARTKTGENIIRRAKVPCISGHKLKNVEEVEKLKPDQYEMELQQQKWKTQELRENLLSLLEKSDPEYQYLHFRCQRYTFSMSRENACLKMHNESFGLNETGAAGATPPKQSRNSEP